MRETSRKNKLMISFYKRTINRTKQPKQTNELSKDAAGMLQKGFPIITAINHQKG